MWDEAFGFGDFSWTGRLCARAGSALCCVFVGACVLRLRPVLSARVLAHHLEADAAVVRRVGKALVAGVVVVAAVRALFSVVAPRAEAKRCAAGKPFGPAEGTPCVFPFLVHGDPAQQMHWDCVRAPGSDLEWCYTKNNFKTAVSGEPAPCKPAGEPCELPFTTTVLEWALAVALATAFAHEWLSRTRPGRTEHEMRTLRKLTKSPSESDGPGKPTERLPMIDNARFALVCVVFFESSVVVLGSDFGSEDNALLGDLNAFGKLTLLPCVAFVAGLSFRGTPSPARLRSLLTNFVAPFALARLLWWLLWGTLDTHLWYLGALAQWRVFSFVVSGMKPFPLLSLAVVVGLGAGYLGFGEFGYHCGMNEAFSHLPFFCLGLCTPRAWLARAVERWRVAGLVASAVLALVHHKLGLDGAVAELERYGYYPCMITGDDKGYWDVEANWVWSRRLVLYLASLVYAACFLCLVPSSPAWCTRAGQRSQHIFVLHGFLLQAVRVYSHRLGQSVGTFHLPRFDEQPVLWLAAWASIPLVSRWLASDAVARFARPVVRPAWLEACLFRAPPSELEPAP